MNLKRWLTILFVSAAIGGAGYWLYETRRTSAAVNDRDLVAVERVDFPIIVEGSGTLEAASSVSIGPPVINNMRRFRLSRMVDEGTQVEEGDFLAEFDGSEISQQLRDVTANFQRVQEEYRKKRSDFEVQLRELKLQLEQARSDADKLENKLSQQIGLESAIVVEETRVNRDIARKTVEMLEKKLSFVEQSSKLDLQISQSNEKHYRDVMDDLLDALDSLTVRAPVSGVVVYQRDFNNEPREIGSNVFALDSIMQIPDLSTLRIKVWVDEVDAGKVKIGQDVNIQIEAIQGKTYKGKVTAISSILKQATYDRPLKVAEALVSILEADYDLMRPGMSARVQVLVGNYPQSIVIPLSCIQEREGRSFVQVWHPEQAQWEWREIELLTSNTVAAVVSSGLESDERIRSKPGSQG